MTKSRLEAFSDGVIAIIITIAVLELRAPSGHDWSSLRPLIPILLSYILSFVNLGIYWNNHHHLLQAAKHVNGSVLWANLHLLFWLSLIPWTTGWMGESGFAAVPVAAYGAVLLLSGVAYAILVRSLVHLHGPESHLARAIGTDVKGNLSVAIYVVAVGLAFVNPIIAGLLYVAVAVIWLVPDRRIEQVLPTEDHR